MKLKYDHVTNSSSTSFCCWGIILDDCFRTLPETVKRTIYDSYLKGVDNDCDEKFAQTFEDFCEDPDVYTWSDELNYIIENNLDNMIIEFSPWGQIYIGRPIYTFPDDITIGEAKNQIKRRLKEIGFDQSLIISKVKIKPTYRIY